MMLPTDAIFFGTVTALLLFDMACAYDTKRAGLGWALVIQPCSDVDNYPRK